MSMKVSWDPSFVDQALKNEFKMKFTLLLNYNENDRIWAVQRDNDILLRVSPFCFRTIQRKHVS